MRPILLAILTALYLLAAVALTVTVAHADAGPVDAGPAQIDPIETPSKAVGAVKDLTVEHGIAAGTPWEAVPMNWTCPECGARKEDFEMVQI